MNLLNGTVRIGSTIMTEVNDPLGGSGWLRFEFTFTETSSSEIIKITNAAEGTNGNDLAITALEMVEI